MIWIALYLLIGAVIGINKFYMFHGLIYALLDLFATIIFWGPVYAVVYAARFKDWLMNKKDSFTL